MSKRLNYGSIVVSLFVIFLLIGCDSQSDEKEDLGIAGILPEDTPFLIYLPNVLPEKGFSATNLGQFIQEPEFQATMQPVYDQIMPIVKLMTQNQNIKFNKAELSEYFDGEMAIAIVGILPASDPFSDPVPNMLISLGVTDKFSEAMEGNLQQALNQKGLPSVEVKIQGQTLLKVQGPPPQNIILYTGIFDNRFLFTTSESLMASLLKNDKKTLADSPAYTELQKHIQGKNEVAIELYLNLQTMFSAPDFQEIQPILQTLGIADWKSISFSYSHEDKAQRMAVSVYCPGEKRGITKILAGDTTKSPFISLVPADATGYKEWNWNFSQSFQELLSLIQSNLAPAEFAMIEKYIDSQKFSDFFSAHGTEIAIFHRSPLGGGMFDETIVLAELKDQQSREKIAAFYQSWGLEAKKIPYQGYEIFYWQNKLGTGERFIKAEQDFDPQLLGLLLPYRAYFFIDEKTVAYSMLVQELKNYADFLANKEPNIAETLKPQLDEIGQHSSFMWQAKGANNYAAGYRNFLKQLQSFEGFIREAGVPIEIALLPRPETLEKYWFPSSCIGYSDTNTVSLVGYTSGIPNFSAMDMPDMTMGPSMVMTVPFVAAIAIPGLLRARLSANENAASGTLRSLLTIQEEFRLSCQVDQDNDKVGEYGFIQELVGVSKVRSNKIVGNRFLHPQLGTTATQANGISTVSGYCYVCYLPSAQEYLKETSPIKNIKLSQNAIDLQEKDFLIYAWPANYGTSGKKAYVVSSKGAILYSVNSKTCYSGTTKMPNFNSALTKNKNVWELKPGIGFDGENWTEK